MPQDRGYEVEISQPDDRAGRPAVRTSRYTSFEAAKAALAAAVASLEAKDAGLELVLTLRPL